ncbi:MAG TPA: hypothetical protein VMX13_16280 [Sedimentisphaerales bacterium]|nr:hypothetical protein [Sedimentisphaerales bacterium]
MDTNEVSDNNADLSSAGGGSSCDSGPASSPGKTWKTVVFVIVVALAGTLAAHSMLTASRCGGCGAGGARALWGANQKGSGREAWVCPLVQKVSLGEGANLKDTGCPLHKGQACKNDPTAPVPGCCPGVQASSKSAGCPLAEQAAKACPNSPGAKAPGCCPGGRHRWGQK